MSRLKLPPWSIPDMHPTFFDNESATAIEMVAKIYGVVQTIADEYTSFSERIETLMNQYTDGANEELENFKVGLRQEFQDFIDIVNRKMKGYEIQLKEAVDAMTENIEQTVNNYIAEHGVKLELVYDEEAEELNIVVSEMFDGGLTQEDIDELAGKLEAGDVLTQEDIDELVEKLGV